MKPTTAQWAAAELVVAAVLGDQAAPHADWVQARRVAEGAW